MGNVTPLMQIMFVRTQPRLDGYLLLTNSITTKQIFIIEGLMTVVMAVACFLFLIDSPSLSSAWLTPDEIRYLELRQVARHGQKSTKGHDEKSFDKNALIDVMTDWKMYLLIFGSWSNAVPNYALKFNLPTIVKSMGFTSAKAQLLTIPPYAIGAFSAYGISVLADKYRWRMPFIVGPQISVVVGFSILFTKAASIQNNIPLCYFAVCLACFGFVSFIFTLFSQGHWPLGRDHKANLIARMYPIFPGVNAWNVANSAGASKRAISIGYLVCAGNIGGVVGSYIYIDAEAPRYTTGYSTSLSFASAGILAMLILEFALWTINKKNAQLTEEDVRSKYTEEELERLGDRSPLYKYAL